MVSVSRVTVADGALGGRGVFGEVKNDGDRTLSSVEITIFFLDRNKTPIAETTYHPVLVSTFSSGDADAPLRPGYSRKFGVRADAPSDWAGTVDVKVTEVQFAKVDLS
jgi:hypothetical protein